MTSPESPFGRRELLRGGIALAALGLAGCSDSSGDPFDSGTDGSPANPNDGSGADGGSPDAGSNPAGSNDDGSASGDGTGDGSGDPGTGAIGQVVTGEYAALAVEYVRSAETVMDYREVPRTDEDDSWGRSRDLTWLQEKGFARGATGLYAVGVAIKNRGETLLSVQTTMLQSEDGMQMEVFMGRSQRLTFAQTRGGGGVNLRPGELVRAELVFALPDDPSNYQFVLVPTQLPTARSEKLRVDLWAGEDGQAAFQNEVTLATHGSPTAVGDFDLTLHSVGTAASAVDSPYQDIFGPREGFEYVLVDVTATRTSDEMIGQDWGFGVVDAEGYSYMWTHGITFQDRMDLDRTTLEDLAVGETLSHTKFAFPLETGFDPVTLAFEAPGPYADTVIDSGLARALWPLT
jgi:hypothetical protein